MKTAIIIPVYNEEKFIADTIAGIRLSSSADLYIVDDGSVDATPTILSSIEGIEVFNYGKNMGKGYALNYALSKIIERYEVIGFLDGDIGASASECCKLIEPFEKKERVDMTIAQFPTAKRKGGFGLVKKLAFEGIRFFTGKEIYSGLSGQRFFRQKVLLDFGKLPYGYGVEVGMIIDILKRGYVIQEVPVKMTHQETGRDLSGFLHRGRQFVDIWMVLIQKFFERTA